MTGHSFIKIIPTAGLRADYQGKKLWRLTQSCLGLGVACLLVSSVFRSAICGLNLSLSLRTWPQAWSLFNLHNSQMFSRQFLTQKLARRLRSTRAVLLAATSNHEPGYQALFGPLKFSISCHLVVRSYPGHSISNGIRRWYQKMNEMSREWKGDPGGDGAQAFWLEMISISLRVNNVLRVISASRLRIEIFLWG